MDKTIEETNPTYGEWTTYPCEGWRRRGGVFTLGPVKWEQCKNDAIVMLTVIQDGKQTIQPACQKCWQEGADNKNIIIINVKSLAND